MNAGPFPAGRSHGTHAERVLVPEGETLPYPAWTCSWFAMCSRQAGGWVMHPALGAVPTCDDCATMLGLDFMEVQVS